MISSNVRGVSPRSIIAANLSASLALFEIAYKRFGEPFHAFVVLCDKSNAQPPAKKENNL